MSLSFAIVGCGALGGYYGARLHHAGFETHFVLHRDYEHVRAHGLRVDSIDGDLSIAQPLCWPNLASLPPCDVICLSLKATANASLREHLAAKVKPGGCVLVLQNGLGIEEEIATWVPGVPVLGGLCFLCSNKIGPGHIHHLDYGAIRLGALASQSEASQALLAELREHFIQAKIETFIAKDLAQARWQKLVWNIPFNGLSVLLRADTQELMQKPSARALVHSLMLEVEAASIACQSPIPNGFIEKMLADTERMAPYLPSMRLDFDRQQPMEIDAIYSRPIAWAAQHGYEMIRTRMLRDQLQALQP